MLSHEVISFVAFLLLVAFMLFIDLGVFHKDDHVVSAKEAAIWSGVWIGTALLFSFVLYFWGDLIHNITSFADLQAINQKYSHGLKIDESVGLAANIANYRHSLSLEYLSGLLIEKSLSVDNIFVMILVFTSFNINRIYYHRVLFWGIITAVVLRFVFIFTCSAIIVRFEWVLAVFGVVLIFSGVKMFFSNDDEQIDTDNHPMVKFASKHFSLLPGDHGHNFFVRQDGKLYITALFLVLLVIEFTDIVFAVDSIPAIFAVTKDPFIVFFSNIFAILGLRSLFFLLDSVMNKFWFLHYGLSVLLTFIGVEMLIDIVFGISITTFVSLMVIIGILVLSVSISLLFPQKEESK